VRLRQVLARPITAGVSRAGNREDCRVFVLDQFFNPQATGDDNLFSEASPIALSDSSTAASMKPQVLTITRSASW
jgi:hypothetical protein